MASLDRSLGSAQRTAKDEAATEPRSTDGRGNNGRVEPRRGGARSERETGQSNRCPGREIQDGFRDARRGRLYARRDQRGAQHSDWNVEVPPLPGSRQAARRAGGFCTGVGVMTEDKFEKFLKQTAESYNAPPARVPREEMWSAIQAKRAAGPQVVYGGGLASHGASARRFGTRVWMGAAAAAMLLVATGVGIGRGTAAPATPANPSAQATSRVSPLVVDNGESGIGTTDQQPTGSAKTTPAGGASGVNTVATTRSSQGSDRSGNGGNDLDRLPSSPSGSSSAYQLTTMQHLSEAEALLTSFRSRSTADQQMDAQLGAWARQLLSNTRLLLDSPVANDPQRRPLLEDLELVLVQIVQLSPGSTPQDREMIEKTL